MQKRTSTLLFLAMLVVTIFLVTGCLELLVKTDLKPDGSAERVFSIYLNFGDQGLEFQREMQRPFTEKQSLFYATLKRYGVAELVELRKYSRENTIVWEEEYFFPSIQKINDMGGMVMFNVAANTSWEATTYQGEPVWAYRESWWLLQEFEPEEDSVHSIPYPLGPPFPAPSKELRQGGLVKPFVASSIGITDRYDITMPGEIIATNADRHEGANATWLFGTRLHDRHMWAICRRAQ
jgi:hypothetical protein